MRRTDRAVRRIGAAALVAAALALRLVAPAEAGQRTGVEADMTLAQQNYVLQCMGCHNAGGAGDAGRIPPLRDTSAKFLGVPGGREYLASVPGSSSASMSDAELAGVLNYIVLRFNAPELRAGFVPFDAAEVARVRRPELADPAGVRGALIDKLHARGRPAPDRDY